MTFPGEFLHGVLPTAATSDGASDQVGGARGSGAEQRLTLLIAWYVRATRGVTARRARVGPQALVPRPTRTTTWPSELKWPPSGVRWGGGEAGKQEQEAVGREEGKQETVKRDEINRGRCDAMAPHPPHETSEISVCEVSPAWVPVGGKGGRRGDEAELEVPCALQQHFFLKKCDDVEQRLWEEHGWDGTWAEVADRAATKRSKQ
tara:strand:- start:1100 stop:1714 length:615 start_codon:yes stop_codon:yes gene_type:complete